LARAGLQDPISDVIKEVEVVWKGTPQGVKVAYMQLNNNTRES